MIVDGDKRIMTADELETFIFQAKVQQREACAKIADDYSDWTYWGQTDNHAAAEAAAEEIAAAIRKGRPLTTDEITEVDKARSARLKAQRER